VIEREVLRKPFCRLLRFKRYSDDAGNLRELKDDPPVLVVAPLSGHHATLLRDTVRTLLQDHKVYITDWIDARMVPAADGTFSLDDYVGYIQEFIRHIGADDLHVISVCQPTVPVLAAVSLMAARGEATPRSLVMMGGPIDSRQSPTAVNNLATQKPLWWFESNVIQIVPANYPGRGRRVYPGFLQHTGFMAMNPERHAMSHWDFYQDLVKGDLGDAAAHRRFYDEYNAVLDMPAKYYLDTVRIVFQEHLLPRGLWDVAGERVDPSAIKGTALLTIEGELDDISGQGQTRAAHALCSSIAQQDRQHLTVEGAGHYGIFSGRRWRTQVYPQVRDFIAAHIA
jgi:poly(3-hydroxybutyrate) depolymerase